MVTPEPQVCAPSQHFRAVLGDRSLVLLRCFQRPPTPPLLLRSSRSLIGVKAPTRCSPSPLPPFITSALFTLGRFVLRRLKPFFLINGLTSPPETAISHTIPVKQRLWKAAQIEATPPHPLPLPSPPANCCFIKNSAARAVATSVTQSDQSKRGEQNGLEEEEPGRGSVTERRVVAQHLHVQTAERKYRILIRRNCARELLCWRAACGDVLLTHPHHVSPSSPPKAI